MNHIGTILTAVRRTAPLVQCITNFVTVNDCANILLAVGGSPTMANHPGETAEAVAGVRALVCNLGAIERVDAMLLAGKAANALGIPVILDPVAAGTTALRRRETATLLQEVRFTVIRGNASEIRYLAGLPSHGAGVDAGDTVREADWDALKQFARETGSVLAVSGAVDVITDGTRLARISNGCATMARITGSGCMLSALLGAFCASHGDALEAVCAGVAAMGICGEIAEERRQMQGTGNATFRTDLIDAMFNLTPDTLERRMRCEIC